MELPDEPPIQIEIPATLWQRAAMTEALSNRDMGRVFQLVRQYALEPVRPSWPSPAA